MQSEPSSSSTMRILRCVGMHPTRGLIHGTAFLKSPERVRTRVVELKQSMFAQGCVRVSQVLAHRVEEWLSAEKELAREKKDLKYAFKRYG